MYVSKFSLLFVSISLPWETIASPELRLHNSPSCGAIRGSKHQAPISQSQKDAISCERAGKSTKT